MLLGLYSLGGARGFAVYSRSCSSARRYFICVSVWSALYSVRRRLASAHVQTILQATVDMFVLVLLLHTCGGVASGLGLLFLVPVGGLGVPAAAAQRPVPGRGCRHRHPCRHDLAAARRHIRHQLLRHRRLARRRVVRHRRAASASRPAACAKAKIWFVRKTWISRIWRSCPNTSCSICAKASWSSMPPTRFASSTSRPRKFSATIMPSRARWWARCRRACCIPCRRGGSASKARIRRRASWRPTARG